MPVRNHRDLRAWQLAAEMKERILRITSDTLWSDHRWLRDQLRKAASSACVNIAEGFSRYHPKDFARFLAISRGSLSEVIEHLDDARRLGLLATDEAEEMQVLARRARGAATHLLNYLRTASPPPPGRSSDSENPRTGEALRTPRPSEPPEPPEPAEPPEPSQPSHSKSADERSRDTEKHDADEAVAARDRETRADNRARNLKRRHRESVSVRHVTGGGKEQER